MQQSRSFFLLSVLVVSAIAPLCCTIPIVAQVDRSAIIGTITDPSGRPLGQAHITAIENSTQRRREGVSDSLGRYGVAELPVGSYTITFGYPGFETLMFSNVQQVVGVFPHPECEVERYQGARNTWRSLPALS